MILWSGYLPGSSTIYISMLASAARQLVVSWGGELADVDEQTESSNMSSFRQFTCFHTLPCNIASFRGQNQPPTPNTPPKRMTIQSCTPHSCKDQFPQAQELSPSILSEAGYLIGVGLTNRSHHRGSLPRRWSGPCHRIHLESRDQCRFWYAIRIVSGRSAEDVAASCRRV